MFVIAKNSTNDLVFTGTERVTLPSPTFLFAFKSRQTKNITSFIGQNISSATSRYDLIRLVETGTTYVNLTASTVNLSPGGFFDYIIYEQASATNLNPSLAGDVLEVGIVRVTGYDVEPRTYFSGASISNNIFLKTP